MNAQITTSQTEQKFNSATHQKSCEELQFYAQPYTPDAFGFYFTTEEEFNEKSATLTDRFGNQVEEFEIQFIDGTDEQSDLFAACKVNQTNIGQFLAILEDVPSYQLPALYYLMDDLGYSMEDAIGKIDDVNTRDGELRDAAEELFDECYASSIPEKLRQYIDYDAFARDLDMNGDMSEFVFAGETYTVTNANGL